MRDPTSAEVPRRAVLRRAALGGVAAGMVWVAPSVSTTVSAAAAVGSVPPGGGTGPTTSVPSPPPDLDDPVEPVDPAEDAEPTSSGSPLQLDGPRVLGTEVSADHPPAVDGTGIAGGSAGETLPRTGIALDARRAAAGVLLGGATAMALLRHAAGGVEDADVWVARAPGSVWRRLPAGQTAVLAPSGPPLVLDRAGSRLWALLDHPVRLRDVLRGDPAGDGHHSDGDGAVLEALHASGLVVQVPPPL